MSKGKSQIKSPKSEAVEKSPIQRVRRNLSLTDQVQAAWHHPYPMTSRSAFDDKGAYMVTGFSPNYQVHGPFLQTPLHGRSFTTFHEVDNTSLETAFQRGRQSAFEELMHELSKTTIALENVALEKVNAAIKETADIANKNAIELLYAFSKMKSWSEVISLLIVSVGDYSDDRIEILYNYCNELAEKLNSDEFNWSYQITYYSENLDLDKILLDGFNINHEQIVKSCEAQ